jgi:2,5-diamino-6-(ribosylamino)-4(3H)-pyrimidinone 5'-phosphate reductase
VTNAVPAPPRPEVLVNCAVSADGRLAYAGGRRARLSGPNDLARVHWMRADVDGIVVGVGTVLLDDPSLKVDAARIDRPVGRAPTRIVLDSTGRTPASAKVLDGSAPTLLAVSDDCRREFPSHVTVVRAGAHRVGIPRLFAELARRGFRKVLVEGGAEVLASVLRSGLFDRWTVYVAPVVIGGTTAPPTVRGIETADADGSVGLRFVGADAIDDGVVLTYLPGRRLSSGTSPEPAGTSR